MVPTHPMFSQRPDMSFSPNGKQAIVFFDFDNTITHFDILDDIIERFSINRDWVRFEDDWSNGRIGSKECLEGQLKSVRVTKQTLSEYLSTIELDPSFGKLLSLFKKNGIEFVIVSDSFSFIIKEILRHNGIRGVKVYANNVKFRGDELIPSFPYASKDCTRCAHCKKKHVLEHKDKKTIYIGDGLSDICPAQESDMVFAKENLLDHLRKTQTPCVAFRNLGDVYRYFGTLDGTKPKVKKVLAAV